MGASISPGIGNRIAPARFLLFACVALVMTPLAAAYFGWRHGIMIGFDGAAIAFLIACAPLLGHQADAIRRTAERNDANRAILLAITGAVTVVILIAVATELMQRSSHNPPVIGLIIATLIIAWLFSNLVYALHYAHLFYSQDGEGGDRGGLDVPGTKEPDYWDFLYFSFTLGMTFQTSDVDVTSPAIRRVVLFHSMAAFVFNIGVLAFSINVLGGG